MITTVKLGKKDRKNPKKKQKKIKETVEKWCLSWNGLVIPINYRKDDLYFIESLEKAPQYCRIVRKIVKGILIENGIISDRITTHSLRHTFVTLNLLNGATLQEVQSMARHTSINTTLIYAHNIDKLKSDNEQKLDNLLNG